MGATAQIGLALTAGLLCGLAVGWLGGTAPGGGRHSWARGWPAALALLLAAGFGLPALGWLGGRPALWLQAAGLLLAAYLAGCAAGCAARRAASP